MPGAPHAQLGKRAPSVSQPRPLLDRMARGGAAVVLAAFLPRAWSTSTQWLLAFVVGATAVTAYVNTTTRASMAFTVLTALSPTLAAHPYLLASARGRAVTARAVALPRARRGCGRPPLREHGRAGPSRGSLRGVVRGGGGPSGAGDGGMAPMAASGAIRSSDRGDGGRPLRRLGGGRRQDARAGGGHRRRRRRCADALHVGPREPSPGLASRPGRRVALHPNLLAQHGHGSGLSSCHRAGDAASTGPTWWDISSSSPGRSRWQ